MAELAMANVLGGAPEDGAVDAAVTSNITVEMLDYEYVRKCSDATELRGIVSVLKSGREGSYPQLLKEAEEKLLSVLPEKERKKYLSLFSTATPAEISQAEEEIMSWQDSIAKTDSALRAKNPAKASKPRSRIPAVRGSSGSTSEGSSSISMQENNTSSANAGSTSSASSTDSKKPERLSGYDFRAWEKFDVDEAISKLDDEEEEREKKNEKEAAAIAEKVRQEELTKTSKRFQLHEKEMQRLRFMLDADAMSSTERKLKALREKEKGNECYKANELDNAVLHYSKSICLDPENPILYCNRAQVYLKLNRFEAAEDDCTMALERDLGQVKAWLRRGSARSRRGNYWHAIADYLEAKKLDPEHPEIMSLLRKAEDKYYEVEGRHYDPAAPPRSAAPPAPGSVNASGSVELKVSSEEEFLLPFRSAKSKLETIGRGRCTVKEIAKPEPPPPREEATAPPSSSFTRVMITEDDDDDEEEKGEDEIEVGEVAASSSGSGLTRIAISEDDEDEEEEEETGGEGSGGLTRIAITEEDEDEGEECMEAGDGGVESTMIEEADRLKEQGNIYMSKGGVEDAIKCYTKAVERNPKCFAAFCNRALAYLESKLFKAAAEDSTRVVDSGDQNLRVKALFRRASAYLGLGMSGAASEDVDSLLAIDPANPAALKLKEEVALQVASKVESKAVDDVGDIEFEVKKLQAKARKYLSDGDSASAVKVLRDVTSMLEKNNEGSTRKWTAGVSHDDDDVYGSTLLLLGKAYSGIEDNASAIFTYDKLIKRSPRNFKAYLRRGEAKFRTGDLQAARSDVLYALKIDPTNSEALQLADMIAQVENKGVEIVGNKAMESEESRLAESERLKSAGNEAVRKGDFQEAVRLYSKAVEYKSDNLAAIGNRAQVHLKLLRFVDAERDASTVLKMIAESSEEKKKSKDFFALKVKALYRRGLARRSMGGAGNLEKALDDFSLALDLEPGNKAAATEKTRTEQLIREQKKSSAMSVNQKTPKIESAAGSAMISELKTTRKPKQTMNVENVTSPPPPPSSDVEAATTVGFSKEKDAPSIEKKKTVSKALSSPSKRSPVKVPSLPTEQPKTVYELERVWRGMKSYPELFAKYLMSLKSATVKKVFNDNVSSDLFTSFFEVSRAHICSESPKEALRLLESISLMKGFALMASLWPQNDQKNIEQILNVVVSFDPTCEERVRELRSKYGV